MHSERTRRAPGSKCGMYIIREENVERETRPRSRTGDVNPAVILYIREMYGSRWSGKEKSRAITFPETRGAANTRVRISPL